MQKIGRKAGHWALLWLGAVLAGLLALVLVNLLPEGPVLTHAREGRAVLEAESHEMITEVYMGWGSRLDSPADSAMLRSATRGEGNALQSAMDMHTYARYWHGYVVVLRPLLAFFSFGTIRYLSMLLHTVLLCMVFYAISKRLGLGIALCYALTVAMAYGMIVHLSMQYSNMFYLQYLLCWAVLKWGDRPRMTRHTATFFFAVGMLTAYVDFLTAPLLTLGLPLLLLLLIRQRDGTVLEEPWRELAWTVGQSAAWACGYGLMWAAKWPLASAVLGRNVIGEAVQQTALRVQGNVQETVDRTVLYQENFARMFPPLVLCAVGLFALLTLVWLLVWDRPSWRRMPRLMPMALVALYPYLWYTVLANHSQIHAWFTYRAQMLTAFAILAGLVSCWDVSRLRAVWHGRVTKR